MPLRHAAMLEVNEFLVLDYVRDRGTAARPEIARELALSAASVSRIVNRLLRAGLVVEQGREASDVGRPATLLAFNPRAGAVMAIDLGAGTCRGALADLAGDTLHEVERPTVGGAAFSTLVETIGQLSAEADRAGVPVSGLAVGVPAIVDPDTGVGRAGPSVQWDAFDIAAALAPRVSAPFVVENDVNLAALGHAWRGDARHVDDFFTLHLGAGVGGAVFANGSLVKGRHNGAGEVGYLLVDPSQSRRPLDGSLGDMERLISASALAERARAIATEAGASQGARDDDLAAATSLLAAAAGGEARAAREVDRFVDRVSMILVAVGSIFDPSLVILDGPIGRELRPWTGAIGAALEARLPRSPAVRVSALGGGSTLLGAVAAALQLERRQAAPPAVFGVFSTSEEARMG